MSANVTTLQRIDVQLSPMWYFCRLILANIHIGKVILKGSRCAGVSGTSRSNESNELQEEKM